MGRSDPARSSGNIQESTWFCRSDREAVHVHCHELNFQHLPADPTLPGKLGSPQDYASIK